jgi:hypothetical protein
MIFDESFPLVFAGSLVENPAIHDGAIMIGRSEKIAPYRIIGWSHRLYPREGPRRAEPNRGSAFNSCLAMSAVEMVDRVYLISRGKVFRFEKGIITRF